MAFYRALPKSPSHPGSRGPQSRPDAASASRARTRTRVLIVDDKGIMRDGLCALLASTHDIVVVSTESTGAEALDSAVNTRPHVMIVDFAHAMPNGGELITSIKTRLPDTRVLVLAIRKDQFLVDAALRAGADGYLLKSDGSNDFFMALRSLAAGRRFISPSIAERATSGDARSRNAGSLRGGVADDLTERERQVIRLIAAGHRTREIAKHLSLSPKTIEKHRTSLMRKLGLRNASAVAAYAIAHGLGDA